MARFVCIPADGTAPRLDDGFDPGNPDFERYVVDSQEKADDRDGEVCLWLPRPVRFSDVMANMVATIAFGGGQFPGLPPVLYGPVYLARHDDAEPAEPAGAGAGAGAGGGHPLGFSTTQDGSGEELPLPLRWRRHLKDARSIHNDGIHPKKVDLGKGRLWATCSPEVQDECIPVGLSKDHKCPVLPYRGHICDISKRVARRYHHPLSTAPAATETETEPSTKRRKPERQELELVVVAGTGPPFNKYVVWVTLQAYGPSITPWFRPQWPDRVGKPGPTAEACLDFESALTELVSNHHGGRSGNPPRVGLAGKVPPGGYKTDEDYIGQCGHWRAGKALLACEWMATLLFAACVYGYEGVDTADFQQAVLWCELPKGICKPEVSNYEEWLKNPGSVRPRLL
jgi:hypothetical protein